MRTKMRSSILLAALCALCLGFSACGDADKPVAEKPAAVKPAAKPAPTPAGAVQPASRHVVTPEADQKPILIKLPKPLFMGTPKNLRVANLEPPRTKPRPPFMAPAGVKNVALGKPVDGSDEDPIIGDLEYITDGDKAGTDGTYVDLNFGTQHVQIDLEGMYEIHAVVVWHFHQEGRVYHDVVIQVADDADFIHNVRTLFNNDDDNSSGQGVGKDRPYLETHEGKLIKAGGVKARFVRLYSCGNTSNDQNHYVEVEVHGKPVK